MEAELCALRERIERLERETGSLKRQRWLALAGLGIALLVLGSPLGRTEDGAQNLICRSLKVVDQDGNPRVTLDIQATGGRLAVAGNDAKPRAVVGVDHDAGFTDWYGADGKPRASLFGSAEGNAELHLSGADAEVKSLIGAGPTGGFFGLKGNDGNVRVYGGVDHSAGYVDWFGPDGKLRTSVTTTAAGEGQVRLVDAAGKRRVTVSALKAGGAVTVHDAAGLEKGRLTSAPGNAAIR